MNETDNFPSHGLNGKRKEEVRTYLMERQQGKCALCEVSQEKLRAFYEASPWKHAHNPVHWKFHIDHCHRTGMIRGLLCESCNLMLSDVEHYAFSSEGSEFFQDALRVYNVGWWMKRHQERLLSYMNQEHWLPREWR